MGRSDGEELLGEVCGLSMYMSLYRCETTLKLELCTFLFKYCYI